MSFPSAFLPSPPDPASRQPFTTAAFLPLYSLHYVLAVLAILPHTFILKLALLPILLWQAWKCATGLDFSAGLANLFGLESSARVNQFNFMFVVGLFDMALRSVDWTFANKPLRRYNPPVDGQHAPIERPLSIPNVLLDALDLICNLRGIGWSWSYKPFPSMSTRSTSIPVIMAKLLFKLVVFDASQYLVQYFRPTVNTPAGDTLFDPTLSMAQRCAWATFYTVLGGVVVFVTVDVAYHIATLVGRILLRQSTWQWPPLFDRPWTSTSITDCWSFRWHQLFRHEFVVFGSQPGRALLGRPGAVVGAFAVSGVLHNLGMWGLGRGTEFSTIGGFFLLMGVGATLEYGFKQATGRRVGGLWGWAWTMVWTISWGTLMIDAWARRGMIAADFFPDRLRPGKLLVNALISLSRRDSDTHS
ncbi:hypothetical protein BGY98DRAFT_1084902 [Russula aff. rugulosa BPL654]|nr:hypothetical protein BGY98DRAFT_1084902 [Russula aff. rugulosa BPL654]